MEGVGDPKKKKRNPIRAKEVFVSWLVRTSWEISSWKGNPSSVGKLLICPFSGEIAEENSTLAWLWEVWAGGPASMGHPGAPSWHSAGPGSTASARVSLDPEAVQPGDSP